MKKAEYLQHNDETSPARRLLRKKRGVDLDARVILHQADAILVVVPVGACAVDCITVKCGVHLGFTLDHLDSETL